ncbi:hypothetical protein [Pseudomonas sp. NPDC007930]|uniref:hypothetical protein n=1 Tax=Pseudomonas sp. NPDC007930 TaxID=3364417 RepID=UPI0036F0CF62
MKQPPRYPDYITPRAPAWRRWGWGLLLLWGGQTLLALLLWPEGAPRAALWGYSAVLPLCWLAALGLRLWVWQVGLLNRAAFRRTVGAARAQWWAWRGASVPVQEVTLLGPAGAEQGAYRQLMALARRPSAEGPGQVLRCSPALDPHASRAAAVAADLAREVLARPGVALHGPRLRGVAWAGEAAGLAAFSAAFAEAGVVLPALVLDVGGAEGLDLLIDRYHQQSGDDVLLCAGVTTPQPGASTGEAAFAWWLAPGATAHLHRSDELAGAAPAAECCAVAEQAAGLKRPPPHCLALGEAALGSFAAAGWQAGAHELSRYWGTLGGFAPFVAASLAVLQAADGQQACGWLCEYPEQSIAMGVAVFHE